MATIAMNTNSTTSSNAGTGVKQLRGSVVVMQNDIDFAAATTIKGSALAANDILQAVTLPKNTMILYAGFKVLDIASNTSSDIVLHLGITGTEETGSSSGVEQFAASFDYDAASVGDHSTPTYSSGVMSLLPTYAKADGTLDLEFQAGTTLTAGKVRVYCVCVIMDDVTQVESPNEVQRDYLA